MRRANHRPPLRYEWRRGIIYVLDPTDDEWREASPQVVYRARVSPETLINAMKLRGTWHWSIIHVSPAALHVDGGVTQTLRLAKERAELAATAFRSERPIWIEEDGAEQPDNAGNDGLPF